jgi:hypothetical protein
VHRRVRRTRSSGVRRPYGDRGWWTQAGDGSGKPPMYVRMNGSVARTVGAVRAKTWSVVPP